MTCSNCGNQNTESARFCINCGATLRSSKFAAEAETLVSSGESGPMTATLLEAEQKEHFLGRTIEGRYRIDSLIGVGGMGAVYRATRVLIGDEVAIKILHTERGADPHAAERFRREAQAAARLKHPNAVSIYDFGITSDGLQYLVMDLIEGQSLRQMIKQQGPLSPSVAAEITTQVCAALDEAHRQNIVHRDIKPDNIIINSALAGLRVKVLDFGIAKLRDDVASHLTQTGTVMGTPHYMSPEQCLGEELDARSDVYSLGIVLYEMLCGRVPFNSPVSTAVVVQHVSQPPPPLRSINISISPQVEAVVLHALEKRRDARPPSARTFAEALTRAVHQTSTQAPSYSTWQRMSGPVQVPPPKTEETVMQGAAPTRPGNEMPATVHLPSARASGPTAPVRSTVPSGALGVTKANQRLVLTIGAAVLGVILLGVVAAVITGSLTREGKPPEQISGGTKDSKSESDTTPPPGMVYVPGGEFTMGSNIGDPFAKPAHRVTVERFFVDIYEVTREDYQKFISATGRPAPKGWVKGHYRSGSGRLPVTGVSWDDANAYAAWVGKRLPTEAEWEFAARGTDQRKYPWGNEWKRQAGHVGSNELDEVGKHPNGASPFGAFDMVGNAWEWTATDLASYPGGQLPERLSGGTEVPGKVIRGGCYLSNREQATTTFRRGWPPRGANYDETGFRCVKDVGFPDQR